MENGLVITPVIIIYHQASNLVVVRKNSEREWTKEWILCFKLLVNMTLYLHAAGTA